jgi:subtilisin family serine protease
MLDCSGSGTISNTVAALDWVATNAKKPAVVTLSLGVQEGSWSRVLDDAVRNLINKQGITVIVAAGNSALDACNVAPANVPEAITVAATSVDDEYNRTQASVQEYSSALETMYTWSNTGPCIDIFAPGVNIYSACGAPSRCAVLNNSSYTVSSGTSMAAPLVAGVAAVYLSTNGQAQPSDVSSTIVSEATVGVVNASEFMQGTPNRLIFSKIVAKNVAAAGGP